MYWLVVVILILLLISSLSFDAVLCSDFGRTVFRRAVILISHADAMDRLVTIFSIWIPNMSYCTTKTCFDCLIGPKMSHKCHIESNRICFAILLLSRIPRGLSSQILVRIIIFQKFPHNLGGIRSNYFLNLEL